MLLTFLKLSIFSWFLKFWKVLGFLLRFRLFPESLEKVEFVCEQGVDTNPPKKQEFSSLQFGGFEWDLLQKPENLQFWCLPPQWELLFGCMLLIKWSVSIIKQNESCCGKCGLFCFVLTCLRDRQNGCAFTQTISVLHKKWCRQPHRVTNDKNTILLM